MDSDVVLVAGLVSVLLSLPSFVNSYSEGRVSRFGIFSIVAGAALIAYAFYLKPGGYASEEFGPAVYRVIGMILN